MNSKTIFMRNASKKYSQILGALINPRGYFIYPKEFYLHHRLSFSQEGEDLVLSRIFDGQEAGFYVDVGAHHPQRFSNTYLFYLKGWRGINVDAMPGSMDAFNRLRPRDINLEIPISNHPTEDLIYYEFDEPALNGFSKELSLERDRNTNYNIISTKVLKTERLGDILSKYIKPLQTIDFMSVDVEGLDYEVLLSNNWKEFRPKVLVVEDLKNKDEATNSDIVNFLLSQGYRPYSKLMYSLILLRQDQ
ncbi:MAG TPA: FkbM family methyltransferase [Nodosilinea sp.]|nr:FkbM family methyltransferase [Nodosilinea sp.]